MKVTDITRRALLDHATDVFAENGFDGASVREITRRATSNLAAINYHFGGKEALYLHWQSLRSIPRRYSTKTQSAA